MQRGAQVLLPLVALGLLAVACRALYTMDFAQGTLATCAAAAAAALWSLASFPGYAVEAVRRKPIATNVTPRFATRGQIAFTYYAKAMLRQTPQMLLPMICFVPAQLLQSSGDTLRFSPAWIGVLVFGLVIASSKEVGQLLRPMRVLPLRTRTQAHFALLPPFIVVIPTLTFLFWFTSQQSNDLLWSVLLILVLGLSYLIFFAGGLWATLHQWVMFPLIFGHMLLFMFFIPTGAWQDRWPLVVIALLFSVECFVLLRLLYRRYFWTSDFYRAIRQDPKKEKESAGSPIWDRLTLAITYAFALVMFGMALGLHNSPEEFGLESPPADCIPCEEEEQAPSNGELAFESLQGEALPVSPLEKGGLRGI